MWIYNNIVYSQTQLLSVLQTSRAHFFPGILALVPSSKHFAHRCLLEALGSYLPLQKACPTSTVRCPQLQSSQALLCFLCGLHHHEMPLCSLADLVCCPALFAHWSNSMFWALGHRYPGTQYEVLNVYEVKQILLGLSPGLMAHPGCPRQRGPAHTNGFRCLPEGIIGCECALAHGRVSQSHPGVTLRQ